MDGGRERGRGVRVGWGGWGACEMFQFRSWSLELSQPVLSSDLMSATDAPGRSCERGEREKKEPKAPLKRRVAALRSRFAATRATLAKGHFEGMYQTVRGYCTLGRL